jgi:hypothetical protein
LLNSEKAVTLKLMISPKHSPIVALIHHWKAKRGIDRTSLGQSLSAGGNTAKSFRRLDELLSGAKVSEEFVLRVCKALRIPEGQIAVAWEAHLDQVMAWRVESRRRAAEEMMERRGPHLWGILPKGYHPGLITITGPEGFLLVRLPRGITEMPESEQLNAVGSIARVHYAEHRRCRLDGYEYRAAIGNVSHFSTEGVNLGRIEGLPSDSYSSVRIGNRILETTSREWPG